MNELLQWLVHAIDVGYGAFVIQFFCTGNQLIDAEGFITQISILSTSQSVNCHPLAWRGIISY